MRPLRNTISGVVTALLVVGLAAGCGDDTTTATQDPAPTGTSESPATPDGTEGTDGTEESGVPAELATALEAEGITVTPTDPADGELTEKKALRTLAGGLGPEFVADGPSAYLVEVVASGDDGLAAGARTWMMHLPGVGSAAKPDMVVFLDATSGADLATVYVSAG